MISVLHKNKKYKAVDEMLYRVYQPILWPALKVANATVRKQAAHLFAEAFPVQDPDAPNAEFERVRASFACDCCARDGVVLPSSRSAARMLRVQNEKLG